MSAPTPAAHIDAAIRAAARVTGVDAAALRATAARESAFDAGAQAATSSAAGLFQFIEQTWLSTLQRHGASLGMADAAAQVARGADGRARVDDPAARDAVLSLRFDPQAAALMAGALMRENADALRQGLGREPATGELYVAHFLGARGAVRLLEAEAATPQAPAAALFPEAAEANRPVFYTKDGSALSVTALADNLRATLTDSAHAQTAYQVPALPPPSSAPEGFERQARPAAPRPALLLSSALVEAMASLDLPPTVRQSDQQERSTWREREDARRDRLR